VSPSVSPSLPARCKKVGSEDQRTFPNPAKSLIVHIAVAVHKEPYQGVSFADRNFAVEGKHHSPWEWCRDGKCCPMEAKGASFGAALDSLCLTTSFRSHIATLSPTLLKVAPTSVFREPATLAATSALHATSTAASIGSTTSE